MGCAAGSHRLGNASFFSQAGIPHLGNTREQNSGRQSVAEIRVPLSKIGWHVQITLCYSDDFQQRFLVSAMPAPATDRRGRLPTQGDGDATARPNAMGPNVPTIEESGRC